MNTSARTESPKPDACLAIMYHYARDRFAPPWNGIRGHSVESFSRQVEMLAGRYEPLWHASGHALPSAGRRGVLFTFDDGLADHVEVAAGVLERHGIRGVFLVSSRPLATGRMLTAHMVHLLMCQIGNGTLAEAVWRKLDEADPAHEWAGRLDREAARTMYHYELPELADFKYLLHVTLPIPLRDRLIGELFAEHVGTQSEWSPRWYGTIDQWKDLQARGHLIGGHGSAHEPLGRLTPDEAVEDIQGSMRFLRETFGESPRPFSYPFGSHSDAIADACRAVGFVCAFTTIPGWNRPDTPRYHLHRVDTSELDRFLDKDPKSECRA